jgi:AcrR family transcriptional regulator
MAELARDLGIGTRTLYKHFHSKADLVLEVMTRFAAEMAREQQSRFDRRLSPVERLREVALTWVETRIRFAAVFWREVEQQYPEAMAVWQAQLNVGLAMAHERILPELRSDVPPGLSISLLFASVRHAADPARCDQLGISRQDAVVHAVELWARGALRRPSLRLVASPGGDAS